MRDVELRR